ncbi:unnamed protein product [Victoria cruziana]
MDVPLFSPSSLFCENDGHDDDNMQHPPGVDTSKGESVMFVERSHAFPGMNLRVREFSFHRLNANLLWPGSLSFAEWLVRHGSYLNGRRIIELGSGTGALAIFLAKLLQVDITTTDFDDGDIEENIAHNCKVNGLPVLPHIRHSWGNKFPCEEPNWDLIIANDILLYVKQYPNLVKTVSFLLKSYKLKGDDMASGTEVQPPKPSFLMSWKRRIGREDESLFFSGCEACGLRVEHLGSRIYCISPAYCC